MNGGVEQFNDPDVASTTRGGGRGRRWLLLAVPAAALCMIATAIIIARSRGEVAEQTGAPTSFSVPSTSLTAAPTTTARPSSTVAPAATQGPATTVAVATTTNPAPPPPYDGPVTSIPLNAEFAGATETATAKVPTVSAYRVPLQSPAPFAADWSFPEVTQFGTPTVFLITGTAGPDWLRVLLPMKPNGTEAWVHRSEVSITFTTLRLVVDIGNRSVTMYDGAKVVAQTSAVVGKDSTPTPTGVYYVTDLLQPENPYGAYGPYILATSGRSDAFDFFNGGEPIVALHGTNQPWLIGSAASNGCVRLPNEISTQLASMTPLGTPVYIV